MLLIAWQPLSDAFSQGNNAKIVLLGFIAMLLVILIISLLDLMKQSIMLYYLEQIRHYEEAIKKALDVHQDKTFQIAGEWTEWSSVIHEPIAWRFFIFSYVLVIGFPTAVLFNFESRAYALIYLLIAVILAAMHLAAVRVVINKVNNRAKADLAFG